LLESLSFFYEIASGLLAELFAMALEFKMKIIFFGDIVGRPGREALAKIISQLRKEFKPDLIVANGENLAHGKGITKKSFEEVIGAGVDLVTSGDHIWAQKEVIGLLEDKDIPLLRPANYPPSLPGNGYKILEIGARRVLVINLMGRVFFNQNLDCPFRKADEILEEFKEKADVVIVDFHAEATSEKKALGCYLDGRVSAILGTHTHVPTSDGQILPEGTAYISDVGMVGVKNSILGAKKEVALHHFLTQMPFKYEIAEDNLVEANGVFIEIDTSTGKALKIENIQRLINYSDSGLS